MKNQCSIVTVNLTESKYYVYSEKGNLRNRVMFDDITSKHGKVVEVSPNGANFLLLSFHQKKVPVLSLFQLTEYEFVFIKQFNVLTEIKNYMTNLKTRDPSCRNSREMKS